MLEATELTAELLPEERVRYFMGIGDPEGLIEVIARGVDIFDCVLPTRTARMGTAFTREGRLNLRNAEHAPSAAPLEEGLPLHGLQGFSRGAIRHFVMQKEILGLMLLTEHNLTFLMRWSLPPGPLSSRGVLRRSEAAWVPRGKMQNHVYQLRIRVRHQGAVSEKEESLSGSVMLIIYVVAFIAIFYFMAIRPQQRQRRAHQACSRR